MNHLKNQLTFDVLVAKLEKPDLYVDGDLEIWRDEHISKGMLEAHLSEKTEAASRNRAFINRSVEWISNIAPVAENPKILDLGCGPGLYTERYRKAGYEVTGVDYAKRSIEYAMDRDSLMGRSIKYICADYLSVELEEKFDVITLIYCDFGALKIHEQTKLLTRIEKWLKPGGKLIFDVLTKYYFENHDHLATWNLQKNSGYWKPEPYICIEKQWDYENNIKLHQYVLIDSENRIETARVWTHYFSKEMILERLKTFNYDKIEFFSDVAGKPYVETNEILCVVVEKSGN